MLRFWLMPGWAWRSLGPEGWAMAEPGPRNRDERVAALKMRRKAPIQIEMEGPGLLGQDDRMEHSET